MREIEIERSCDPALLRAELEADGIGVSGVQSSPSRTTVLADVDDAGEAHVRSVAGAHRGTLETTAAFPRFRARLRARRTGS